MKFCPRPSAALPLLLAAFAAAGCGGGKPVTVNGTVTLSNGKPVPLAHITFIGEDGAEASGEVVEGDYSVSDVPVGEKVKVVITLEPILKEIAAAEKAEAIIAARVPPERREEVAAMTEEERQALGIPDVSEIDFEGLREKKRSLIPIPKKYATPQETPLAYPVKKGDQKIDITLDPG